MERCTPLPSADAVEESVPLVPKVSGSASCHRLGQPVRVAQLPLSGCLHTKLSST